MNPTFFATPAALRKWLQKNHASADELWVGFYKKASGRPSITWPEAVDQALCFGWIDGVRKSVSQDSYTNRFTPRRPKSNWSAVNIRRVKELIEHGQMHASGLAVFNARDVNRTNQYSYEQERSDAPALDPALEKKFKANKKAWAFYQAQPPGYRKLTTKWITDGKQEATRQKRLAILISDSANGLRIAQLRRPQK